MIFFHAQIRARKNYKARRSGLTLNVDPTPPYGGKYKWRMSARAYLRTPRLISERDVHFLVGGLDTPSPRRERKHWQTLVPV